MAPGLGSPIAALNFWDWVTGDYFSYAEMSGALYDTELPGLRVSATLFNMSSDEISYISAIGHDSLWTATQIDFDLKADGFWGGSQFYGIDITRTLLVPAP